MLTTRMRRLAVAVSAGLLLVGSVGLAQGATFQGLPVVSVYVNGRFVQSDVPAVKLGGRVMVPLRAVSEALGAQVSWDEASQTASITDPEKCGLAALAFLATYGLAKAAAREVPTEARAVVEKHCDAATVQGLLKLTDQLPAPPLTSPIPPGGTISPVPSLILGTGHWVSEKLDGGRYIRLEDGSLWEIAPLDRINTALWLNADQIVVTASNDVLYPYLLVNTTQGETAKAKLVGR